MSNVSDNRLTSERIKGFQDALEILYIKGNVSGRLHFAHEWPAPAQYIFGDELQGMDAEGTRDKPRRAALEQEAESRRIALLDTVMTLETKSAERGIMNMEYVRDTITNYGRATSLLLYASKIVDRFLPPPEGGDVTEQRPQHSGAYVVPEPEITIEPLPEAMNVIPLDLEPEEGAAPARQSVDPLDAIQPISVGAQAPPPPNAEPPPPPPPRAQDIAPAPIHKPAPAPPGPESPRRPSYDDLPPPSISAPVVAPASPPAEDNYEDKPFSPNAIEHVEESELEPEPAKRSKLNIFGIKDDSNNNGGNTQ
jgi:hypothetical protein